MFWSKLWFFLVAAAAAVLLTIALVLPRPAQRQQTKTESRRIKNACRVAHILLTDNARKRVGLALDLASNAGRRVGDTLEKSTNLKTAVPADYNSTTRGEAQKLIGQVSSKFLKPHFVILADGQGRVVARATRSAGIDGFETTHFGDSVAGYFAVADALRGYLSDDLWTLGKSRGLFRVAAAPVVYKGNYVGVVVTRTCDRR